MKDDIWDSVVIGGGPAGMSAAIAAKETGLSNVLVLDRNSFLGGILPQCIHDGFGLIEFGSSLTGPEYAEKLTEQILERKIPFFLDTTVLKIMGDGPFILSIIGPTSGFCEIRARSIVIASGCRERTLGQLRIPGTRPAGIYTAGAAQYMLNVQNYMPGKSVVILGLGNIGLIMARRLTLEGARVKLILGDRASGLLRNYIQCIHDFKIPLKLNHTIISTHGYQRLKGVTIAPVAEDGTIIFKEKRYVPCDTLLVAAGLIPETELWKYRGASLSDTKGIPVEANMVTPQEGIFACGNVIRVYDTADEVSETGRIAGTSAAQWVLNHKISLKNRVQRVFTMGKKLETEDLSNLEERVICTLCPKGCCLAVTQINGKWFTEGNNCLKGAEYVIDEKKLPKRVVTTTVRIKGGKRELVPVKTDIPVAKEQMPAIIKVCRRVKIEAPILAGTVIVRNIAQTGANLIATGNILARERAGKDL